MVAERKQVDGLGKTPAHPKVSHSRPTATGGNGCTHIQVFLRWNNSDVVLQLGPSKPTGNVGQPANGNLQYLRCQCEIG